MENTNEEIDPQNEVEVKVVNRSVVVAYLNEIHIFNSSF